MRAVRDDSLDVDFIILAYRSGYFPMADSRRGRVSWYSPDPRAIIPLETVHLSRSLRRTVAKNLFDIRVDSSFEEVIRACADRKDTWISDGIIGAYTDLHHRGFAHSVEAWKDGRLAGGLYGIAIGAAFFGESMFTRVTDASKVAFAALVQILHEREYQLLDTQFVNEHMLQFGPVEIPRQEYLAMLTRAVAEADRFPRGGLAGTIFSMTS